MSIDAGAGGSLPPAPKASRPWQVRVDLTVLAVVPPSVLIPWLAVEAHSRDRPECWPSNQALMAPMHVGSVQAVRACLTRLELLGIVERVDMGGNRRLLRLRRRVSEPLSVAEWSAAVAAADQRAAAKSDDRKPLKILGRGALEDSHRGASQDAPMGTRTNREQGRQQCGRKTGRRVAG